MRGKAPVYGSSTPPRPSRRRWVGEGPRTKLALPRFAKTHVGVLVDSALARARPQHEARGGVKLPISLTEGSKNIRHLPRYLSIQRDPEFFSAYHHQDHVSR